MKKAHFLTAIIILIGSPSLFAQWSELGGLNALASNDAVFSICADAAGNVYAAGAFTNSSGNWYVAKYNGSSWSELGGLNALAANGFIHSVCADALGNVYAAGEFTNSSSKYYVAKYNGSTWSELGGFNALAANSDIESVCTDGVYVYAAGYFENPSFKKYVAKYNGSTWSELGGPNALAANAVIMSICTDAAGNVFAGGDFTNGANATLGKKYVAKYNFSSWSELGGPNALAANFYISSVCADAAGNVYAAGGFTNSASNGYVAKYDGSSWNELGGINALAANGGIYSVYADLTGNIYAAGGFSNASGKSYVAKYNGSGWSELGGLNALAANDWIMSNCTDGSGNMYAAGYFTNGATSASGNSYVAKFTIAAGVTTLSSDGSLQLYPNPAHAELMVQSSKLNVESIEVYNALGQRCISEFKIFQSALHIDISKLGAGIYFLRLLTSAGEMQNIKFVKN